MKSNVFSLLHDCCSNWFVKSWDVCIKRTPNITYAHHKYVFKENLVWKKISEIEGYYNHLNIGLNYMAFFLWACRFSLFFLLFHQIENISTSISLWSKLPHRFAGIWDGSWLVTSSVSYDFFLFDLMEKSLGHSFVINVENRKRLSNKNKTCSE